MSRLLILAVILAVTCAMEFNYNYKPGMWRHLAKKHLHHHLERRQASPNCVRALKEYQNPYFQGCLAVLGKFSSDDITNDDLDGYCTNRCNSEIISVSNDLSLYCDGGGSPPDNHEIDILRFLCLRNVNDDYCQIALEKLANDKSAPDFSKCDTSAFPCTDACKAVIRYINYKLGCCFASAVQYSILHFNDTIGFFEKCGSEYIPPC
ncbi:uncharacterized protein [Dysidea avara]|uniref:uncharacterized protein n=1 Tax=Dysidea avara TaxID=196820 RepID=UPI003325B085